MKKAKQILSSLLVFLFICAGISVISSAASGTKLESVGQLEITTNGKAKTIKLSWDKLSKVKGYQIYRSTSGKAGNFKIVATTKETNYTDKALASLTTYYYKVHAFAKQNDENIYGSFSKADLSTRITKAFAQKRLQAVYKVADNQF